MKCGNSYLTPVIITSILSIRFSRNSRSFADFYVHILVQCGHKYRTRHFAFSFANCFVLCFWNILFLLFRYVFLTKHVFRSYVLSWPRRFVFFEPNFCVSFRSHVYFRRKVCYLFYERFCRFLRVSSRADSFPSCCPKGIFYSLIYVVSSVWKRPKNMIL